MEKWGKEDDSLERIDRRSDAIVEETKEVDLLVTERACGSISDLVRCSCTPRVGPGEVT